MTTDIRITQNALGVWDFNLTPEGDLDNGDFLDSSITYALLGEQRASISEVAIAEHRRGWIGNEGADFENGSKIWIYHQSRLTRTTINGIKDAALSALNYFVSDGIATKIDVDVLIENNSLLLKVDIFVSSSKVETKFFTLWQNTGL